MIPIHHRTFVQGLDSSLTFAQDQLKQLVSERHLEDRVMMLGIGEQQILVSVDLFIQIIEEKASLLQDCKIL